MKTIITIIISFLLIGCSPVKYIPIETVKTVTEVVRDTSVIYKPIKEFVYIQTKDTVSRLETSFAVSEASYTNGQLNHRLENKDSIQVKIEYKDRIITVTKEIPVEVVKEVYKTPQ